MTGSVTQEGAAGSIYAPVPVAIKSTEKGGKETIFAGCYLTRIVNAAIQEPPFSPLHIESAELEKVERPTGKGAAESLPFSFIDKSRLSRRSFAGFGLAPSKELAPLKNDHDRERDQERHDQIEQAENGKPGENAGRIHFRQGGNKHQLQNAKPARRMREKR